MPKATTSLENLSLIRHKTVDLEDSDAAHTAVREDAHPETSGDTDLVRVDGPDAPDRGEDISKPAWNSNAHWNETDAPFGSFEELLTRDFNHDARLSKGYHGFDDASPRAKKRRITVNNNGNARTIAKHALSSGMERSKNEVVAREEPVQPPVKLDLSTPAGASDFDSDAPAPRPLFSRKKKEARKAFLTRMLTLMAKMMYVSGETAEPIVETTSMIEDIVRQQVIELVRVGSCR
jgi:hypothetical protein